MADPPIVLEGRLVISRALALPDWHVRLVRLTPTAYAALADSLERTPADRRPVVEIMNAEALEAIGGFSFHQGCLGYADRPASRSWGAIAHDNRPGTVIVVLDDVRDPDNVGSAFRSALAFGARGVLLGPGCADPLYRKAIRTSMAATLALPFADAMPWPALLDELHARGVSIVATTPDPEAEAIARVANRLRDTPIALLVGSEGHGLSAGALARADVRARIQIAAGVDSLNAATAAAIALYELGREGHRRD